MRETIQKMLYYIENLCVEGRDDREIATIYYAIGSMYDALEAIKSVESKSSEFDIDEEQVEE